MNELTISEQSRLESLETVIEKGLTSFYEVGSALLTIRDSRLYRATHGTFEAYCLDRWGMSKPYATQLIGASKVVSNLVAIATVLPATESQTRPLTSLPAEQQAETWQQAVQIAEAANRTVTARDVVNAVNKSKPHVSFNSGENEWYTPTEYVEAARRVMGSIDLDPASSEVANKTVKAKKFYAIDDNGLEQPWHGNVFMNPPYSSDLIKQFSSKYAILVEKGSIQSGIVLVNNATETGWFQEILAVSSAVCLIKGRIKFIDTKGEPSGAPLQGQAILYYGGSIDRFIREFSLFGEVLVHAR
jgi:phage N-6-adenine-methyltransferase